MVAQQKRRLSWRATQAALLITVYHDEPIFQLPFQILTLLQDLDELMTTWRTRHGAFLHIQRFRSVFYFLHSLYTRVSLRQR